MVNNYMNSHSTFKNIANFDKYFFIYLLILGFCALVFLFSKHTVGNDSTISEWLINYQGGLTRRGLIGEICFHVAKFFKSDLRFTIFIFQVFSYFSFLYLTYKFFKDLDINIVALFSIFSPIFLLFPVAEIEVLARKEVFLYIYFLVFLFISDPSSRLHKYVNSYIFLITPVVCLIYEEVILFFPFLVSCLVIQRKTKTFINFFKICSLFTPSILIVLYFFFFPLTLENHELMKQSLLINFNERCYMSCALLVVNDINKFGTIIDSMYSHRTFLEIFSYIVRYLLIILFGFLPLFLLCGNSKLNDQNIFSNFKLDNTLFLLLFLFIPILPLFVFAYDWGRWVGMMITFSTFFYFFLYRYKYINTDFNNIYNRLIFFKNKKKLLIFIFIIFAFGWNQKTVMSGDIATNPLWKVPYNTSKKLFGWESFRILQDSPFSKWHKKYIE